MNSATAQQQKLFAMFIILFAGLGGILYGYDIGIIWGNCHEVGFNGYVYGYPVDPGVG